MLIKLFRVIHFYFIGPLAILSDFFDRWIFVSLVFLWILFELNMKCSNCRSRLIIDQRGDLWSKDTKLFGIHKECKNCGKHTHDEFPFSYLLNKKRVDQE